MARNKSQDPDRGRRHRRHHRAAGAAAARHRGRAVRAGGGLHARSAPASRSAAMQRGSCGRSASAMRWRASPTIRKGATIAPGTPATASTTRRSASGRRRISARRTTPRTAPTCSTSCSAVSARKASASARASSASIRTPTASPSRSPTAATATGDILIGADGIHSTVRGQMFGKELPRYTGNVAWRGLVPAERVAHLDVAKVTGVWMGPNRSIVQYYVAAGRTFNWIGISRSEQPARGVVAGRRAASRMRSPNIPAGTTPSAPSSRRRRSCCARRCTTASRCRTGGSGAWCCWAMPRIR